jgi:tRNA threonylcarbamoyladenosine biosynthesis protein TsaE
MRCRTSSPDETRALATALGSQLGPGDLVLLVGDLGSGKTTFAQGLAKGLGVEVPVTSPTFTLVQQYLGRVPVAHVDVFRLERMQELHDLGIEELVDGPGVTIVEWGDVVKQVLPQTYVLIRIEQDDTEDARAVTIDAVGASWRGRATQVADTIDRFVRGAPTERE